LKNEKRKRIRKKKKMNSLTCLGHVFYGCPEGRERLLGRYLGLKKEKEKP
jgi:hypothetical protein